MNTPDVSRDPHSDHEADLGHRAVRGAATVMTGQMLRIVIQVVSVSILAHLLLPFDYGLIAIVLAIVGLGEIFRDLGLSTAAIQAETLSNRQRDKLFWINTAIGAVLALVTVGLAPFVAELFDQPELAGITRVLALTFLVNGLAAQYRADLNRKMRFAALVYSDIAGQVVGIVCAVVLAVLGAGYWSLVVQQLSGTLAILLIMMVSGRWLPRLPRRGVDVSSMLSFGYRLMATQLLGYVGSNVDTYVIGLRFGPDQLGIYNRGYQLLMKPLNQLRGPSTTVALPVLSRLRNDYDRAGRFVRKGQLALGYSLIPLLAFTAGAAGPIVTILLGDEWTAVAPVFALLSIGGAFQTLSYVGGWVYLSRGLTAELFRYSLVSLTIKVICILVGSAWGIVGVAAGLVVAPAISWPIALWWLSRLTPLPVRALSLAALRMMILASLAAIACRFAVDAVSTLPVLQLTAAAVVWVIVYAVGLLVSRHVRRDFREVVAVARNVIRR